MPLLPDLGRPSNCEVEEYGEGNRIQSILDVVDKKTDDNDPRYPLQYSDVQSGMKLLGVEEECCLPPAMSIPQNMTAITMLNASPHSKDQAVQVYVDGVFVILTNRRKICLSGPRFQKLPDGRITVAPVCISSISEDTAAVPRSVKYFLLQRPEHGLVQNDEGSGDWQEVIAKDISPTACVDLKANVSILPYPCMATRTPMILIYDTLPFQQRRYTMEELREQFKASAKRASDSYFFKFITSALEYIPSFQQVSELLKGGKDGLLVAVATTLGFLIPWLQDNDNAVKAFFNTNVFKIIDWDRNQIFAQIKEIQELLADSNFAPRWQELAEELSKLQKGLLLNEYAQTLATVALVMVYLYYLTNVAASGTSLKKAADALYKMVTPSPLPHVLRPISDFYNKYSMSLPDIAPALDRIKYAVQNKVYDKLSDAELALWRYLKTSESLDPAVLPPEVDNNMLLLTEQWWKQHGVGLGFDDNGNEVVVPNIVDMSGVDPALLSDGAKISSEIKMSVSLAHGNEHVLELQASRPNAWMAFSWMAGWPEHVKECKKIAAELIDLLEDMNSRYDSTSYGSYKEKNKKNAESQLPVIAIQVEDWYTVHLQDYCKSMNNAGRTQNQKAYEDWTGVAWGAYYITVRESFNILFCGESGASTDRISFTSTPLTTNQRRDKFKKESNQPGENILWRFFIGQKAPPRLVRLDVQRQRKEVDKIYDTLQTKDYGTVFDTMLKVRKTAYEIDNSCVGTPILQEDFWQWSDAVAPIYAARRATGLDLLEAANLFKDDLDNRKDSRRLQSGMCIRRFPQIVEFVASETPRAVVVDGVTAKAVEEQKAAKQMHIALKESVAAQDDMTYTIEAAEKSPRSPHLFVIYPAEMLKNAPPCKSCTQNYAWPSSITGSMLPSDVALRVFESMRVQDETGLLLNIAAGRQRTADAALLIKHGLEATVPCADALVAFADALCYAEAKRSTPPRALGELTHASYDEASAAAKVAADVIDAAYGPRGFQNYVLDGGHAFFRCSRFGAIAHSILRHSSAVLQVFDEKADDLPMKASEIDTFHTTQKRAEAAAFGRALRILASKGASYDPKQWPFVPLQSLARDPHFVTDIRAQLQLAGEYFLVMKTLVKAIPAQDQKRIAVLHDAVASRPVLYRSGVEQKLRAIADAAAYQYRAGDRVLSKKTPSFHPPQSLLGACMCRRIDIIESMQDMQATKKLDVFELQTQAGGIWVVPACGLGTAGCRDLSDTPRLEDQPVFWKSLGEWAETPFATFTDVGAAEEQLPRFRPEKGAKHPGNATEAVWEVLDTHVLNPLIVAAPTSSRRGNVCIPHALPEFSARQEASDLPEYPSSAIKQMEDQSVCTTGYLTERSKTLLWMVDRFVQMHVASSVSCMPGTSSFAMTVRAPPRCDFDWLYFAGAALCIARSICASEFALRVEFRLAHEDKKMLQDAETFVRRVLTRACDAFTTINEARAPESIPLSALCHALAIASREGNTTQPTTSPANGSESSDSSDDDSGSEKFNRGTPNILLDLYDGANGSPPPSSANGPENDEKEGGVDTFRDDVAKFLSSTDMEELPITPEIEATDQAKRVMDNALRVAESALEEAEAATKHATDAVQNAQSLDVADESINSAITLKNDVQGAQRTVSEENDKVERAMASVDQARTTFINIQSEVQQQVDKLEKFGKDAFERKYGEIQEAMDNLFGKAAEASASVQGLLEEITKRLNDATEKMNLRIQERVKELRNVDIDDESLVSILMTKFDAAEDAAEKEVTRQLLLVLLDDVLRKADEEVGELKKASVEGAPASDENQPKTSIQKLVINSDKKTATERTLLEIYDKQLLMLAKMQKLDNSNRGRDAQRKVVEDEIEKVKSKLPESETRRLLEEVQAALTQENAAKKEVEKAEAAIKLIQKKARQKSAEKADAKKAAEEKEAATLIQNKARQRSAKAATAKARENKAAAEKAAAKAVAAEAAAKAAAEKAAAEAAEKAAAEKAAAEAAEKAAAEAAEKAAAEEKAAAAARAEDLEKLSKEINEILASITELSSNDSPDDEEQARGNVEQAQASAKEAQEKADGIEKLMASEGDAGTIVGSKVKEAKDMEIKAKRTANAMAAKQIERERKKALEVLDGEHIGVEKIRELSQTLEESTNWYDSLFEPKNADNGLLKEYRKALDLYADFVGFLNLKNETKKKVEAKEEMYTKSYNEFVKKEGGLSDRLQLIRDNLNSGEGTQSTGQFQRTVDGIRARLSLSSYTIKVLHESLPKIEDDGLMLGDSAQIIRSLKSCRGLVSSCMVRGGVDDTCQQAQGCQQTIAATKLQIQGKLAGVEKIMTSLQTTGSAIDTATTKVDVVNDTLVRDEQEVDNVEEQIKVAIKSQIAEMSSKFEDVQDAIQQSIEVQSKLRERVTEDRNAFEVRRSAFTKKVSSMKTTLDWVIDTLVEINRPPRSNVEPVAITALCELRDSVKSYTEHTNGIRYASYALLEPCTYTKPTVPKTIEDGMDVAGMLAISTEETERLATTERKLVQCGASLELLQEAEVDLQTKVSELETIETEFSTKTQNVDTIKRVVDEIKSIDSISTKARYDEHIQKIKVSLDAIASLKGRTQEALNAAEACQSSISNAGDELSKVSDASQLCDSLKEYEKNAAEFKKRRSDNEAALQQISELVMRKDDLPTPIRRLQESFNSVGGQLRDDLLFVEVEVNQLRTACSSWERWTNLVVEEAKTTESILIILPEMKSQITTLQSMQEDWKAKLEEAERQKRNYMTSVFEMHDIALNVTALEGDVGEILKSANSNTSLQTAGEEVLQPQSRKYKRNAYNFYTNEISVIEHDDIDVEEMEADLKEWNDIRRTFSPTIVRMNKLMQETKKVSRVFSEENLLQRIREGVEKIQAVLRQATPYSLKQAEKRVDEEFLDLFKAINALVGKLDDGAKETREVQKLRTVDTLQDLKKACQDIIEYAHGEAVKDIEAVVAFLQGGDVFANLQEQLERMKDAFDNKRRGEDGTERINIVYKNVDVIKKYIIDMVGLKQAIFDAAKNTYVSKYSSDENYCKPNAATTTKALIELFSSYETEGPCEDGEDL